MKAELADLFDTVPFGRPGLAAVGRGEELEALLLQTVGEEGWPHTAWLSTAEVLPIGLDELAFCLWPGSGTTANLRRTGQGTLEVVAAGSAHRLRLQVTSLGDVDVLGRPLAGFRARVVHVRSDAVPYATIRSGPRYQLEPPLEPIIERWSAQLQALASLGGSGPEPR